jgi:circadian clock protein KaiC
MRERQGITKAPIGIAGLDEITSGGLPKGRTTLVCGGPGSGKTLLATAFLVHGARDYGEPGVLISFDQPLAELETDSASLGFGLENLQAQNLLAVDYVHLDRNEVEETGEYDLEGLFVRLALAIDSVGARRLVLDTVDALFAGIPSDAVVRSELRRLFQWLKDRQLSVIVTAERGEGSLTRHGIEEYVSDCVMLLDHRVTTEISTRRLRIVKYRGSAHGTNEYPFLIDEAGFSVLPITSLGLKHQASTERISTGIVELDDMLGGAGYYKGSSILLSGGPGVGKTSIGGHLADAACRRGERCAFVSFEESPAELVRNMKSIGLDLGQWEQRGLLCVQSIRPSYSGLEMHLVFLHRLVSQHAPVVVVVDPVSALAHAGSTASAEATMLRLVDFLKGKGISTLYTSVSDPSDLNARAAISSLMDAWVDVQTVERHGRQVHMLRVVKARGIAHSAETRYVNISARGIRLEEMEPKGHT